jgi:ABC-type multidrug transport system fused ATPase/permease subunit
VKNTLRLLALTRSYWRSYAIALGALLLGTTLFLGVPQSLGAFLTQLPRVSEPELDLALFTPALHIAVLLLAHTLCAGLYSYLLSNASEHIANQLKASFFGKLISRPLDEYSPKQMGEIASEFSSDLAIIQGSLSETLIHFLRHVIFTAGAVIALFIVDARMTAIAMMGVLVIAVVLVAFIRMATRAILTIQKYRARTVSLLLEAASNAYVIQAYGRIDYMNARFSQCLADTLAQVKRHRWWMTLMNPISMAVFALAISGTLAFGIFEVRTGRLTVAGLISFITYALVLVASVSQVGVLAGRLTQAGVLLAKHEALLTDAPAEPVSRPNPLFSPSLRPGEPGGRAPASSPTGYSLDGVVFRYPNSERSALSGVSFQIPAGQVTAIIGESGAGKSTVAGLLCGIYRPYTGALRFIGSGEEANALVPGRHEIAVVPQEPFLFSGTVAENISFGREGITAGAIEQAARAAQIHEHIQGLPGGYGAGVEEGGRNFSRGQRQRIALARALATRPRVLILDEATASLDVVSERAIKSVIQTLRGNVTIVIIAHQGELLADVDHLVVLDRGQVVSAGSPAQADTSRELVGQLTQLRRGQPAGA